MKVAHTNGTRVQVSYNDLILSVLTYQKYVSGNIFHLKKILQSVYSVGGHTYFFKIGDT